MKNTAATAIVIPARLASARLPDKPLADIAGMPMIVQVWRRAVEAGLGPVFVGAGDPAIVDAVSAAGGEAVLTDPGLPSGSDRVARVLEMIDPAGRFATVLNLQGDLPDIAPEAIRACLRPLAEPGVDIATIACRIDDAEELSDPNIVKVIAGPAPDGAVLRAQDFVRHLSRHHAGPHLHHIGIYAYRRRALETFVSLPPSRRERASRLEQLRALDAGMRIDVALVDTLPLGVDTPADLERVRALMASG